MWLAQVFNLWLLINLSFFYASDLLSSFMTMNIHGRILPYLSTHVTFYFRLYSKLSTGPLVYVSKSLRNFTLMGSCLSLKSSALENPGAVFSVRDLDAFRQRQARRNRIRLLMGGFWPRVPRFPSLFIDCYMSWSELYATSQDSLVNIFGKIFSLKFRSRR